MESIFSKIVAGTVPSHKVWEDDDHLAFLDVRPVTVGHTLVIPKKQVDYLFDLSSEEYDALWRAVRTVEAGLRRALDTKRIVVSVVGWEVPHVHVHLIPTNGIGDYPFPASMDSPEDPEALSARLREAF